MGTTMSGRDHGVMGKILQKSILYILGKKIIIVFSRDPKWKKMDKHFPHENKADGEFYMSFRDFLAYFGELELCHLQPDAVGAEGNIKNKFDVFHFNGQWIRGKNSGGCGNAGTCKH